jgi:pilus assembly protein Flp/PilA
MTIRRFLREDDGQGLVEYGLILGLIAIICIAALTQMGTSVDDILNEIATALTGVSS